MKVKFIFLAFFLSALQLFSQDTTKTRQSSAGILFGYEGWRTTVFELGIGFNLDESWSAKENAHDFIGYSLSFKKSIVGNYWGINNDVWLATDYFAFGLNYNFNYESGKTNHGFKPFIGLAFYHFTLCYGINFHNRTSIGEIDSQQLTLRYYLPVVKTE